MQMIKVVCSRCNGSGRYSYSLMHGTKCYGCNGAKFSMADAAKVERSKKAKAVRDAKRQKSNALRASIADVVFAELDAQLGPFADTEKGSHDMVMACHRAFGKGPGDIVNERMQAAA